MDEEKENVSPKPDEPPPATTTDETTHGARGRQSKVLTGLLAFTSVAVLIWALSQSNNGDGRLIGKWKLDSMSGGRSGQATGGLAELSDAGLHICFEFSPNDFRVVYIEDHSGDLERFERVLKAEGRDGFRTVRGTYSLGSGDTVWFTNFDGPTGSKLNGKGKTKSSLVVKDDILTMTDKDGTTMVFSRVADKAK